MDLGSEFCAILDYPADLLRIICTELRLGNALILRTTSDTEIEVACMRYKFLDGHITSNWTVFQPLPSGGPWYAWYLAEDAHRAVACMHESKIGWA